MPEVFVDEPYTFVKAPMMKINIVTAAVLLMARNRRPSLSANREPMMLVTRQKQFRMMLIWSWVVELVMPAWSSMSPR